MRFLKPSPSYQMFLLNSYRQLLRSDFILLFVQSYVYSTILYFVELLLNNLFRLLLVLFNRTTIAHSLYTVSSIMTSLRFILNHRASIQIESQAFPTSAERQCMTSLNS